MKIVLQQTIKDKSDWPIGDIVVTLSQPDNFISVEQDKEYLSLSKSDAKKLISILKDYINYLDLN
jgi:hypothetical protein